MTGRTPNDGRDWTPQPYPPTESPFPSRRYLIECSSAAPGQITKRHHHTRPAAEEIAREESKNFSDVRVVVLDAGEPIGTGYFTNGRGPRTEGDYR